MTLLNTAFADQTSTTPQAAPGGTTIPAPVTATQSASPASTPATPTPAQPGFMSMITLFAPMFLVIYFLIIRPQQKKMKEHQSVLEKIQHGDEIVTNAGIFGKVTGIADAVVTVEIADGVRIKMLKSQIASVTSTKGKA